MRGAKGCAHCRGDGSVGDFGQLFAKSYCQDLKQPKLYRTYSDFLNEHFAFRVQKLPIDAGFTCPNRDGTKGVGGCIYCNNQSFNTS